MSPKLVLSKAGNDLRPVIENAPDSVLTPSHKLSAIQAVTWYLKADEITPPEMEFSEIDENDVAARRRPPYEGKISTFVRNKEMYFARAMQMGREFGLGRKLALVADDIETVLRADRKRSFKHLSNMWTSINYFLKADYITPASLATLDRESAEVIIAARRALGDKTPANFRHLADDFNRAITLYLESKELARLEVPSQAIAPADVVAHELYAQAVANALLVNPALSAMPKAAAQVDALASDLYAEGASSAVLSGPSPALAPVIGLSPAIEPDSKTVSLQKEFQHDVRRALLGHIGDLRNAEVSARDCDFMVFGVNQILLSPQVSHNLKPIDLDLEQLRAAHKYAESPRHLDEGMKGLQWAMAYFDKTYPGVLGDMANVQIPPVIRERIADMRDLPPRLAEAPVAEHQPAEASHGQSSEGLGITIEQRPNFAAGRVQAPEIG